MKEGRDGARVVPYRDPQAEAPSESEIAKDEFYSQACRNGRGRERPERAKSEPTIRAVNLPRSAEMARKKEVVNCMSSIRKRKGVRENM